MALKKIHTFYDFSRLQLYFPDFVQVWEIALQFQDFFNNSRLCTSPMSRALDNLRWRVLLADTKLKRKLGQHFFPKTVPQCNSRQHDPVFATLRLRGRPGWDGCQTALWDCFGGRIFNMAANSSPNTVPQCPLTTITTRSPAQPQGGKLPAI